MGDHVGLPRDHRDQHMAWAHGLSLPDLSIAEMHDFHTEIHKHPEPGPTMLVQHHEEDWATGEELLPVSGLLLSEDVLGGYAVPIQLGGAVRTRRRRGRGRRGGRR